MKNETASESTTPQLTEDAVQEIESREVSLEGWHKGFVLLEPEERDALIRDWRAMRAESAEWDRQARLNQQAYGREMNENAALREQLAATQQELLQAAINEAGVWKVFLRSSGVAPEGDDSADDWAVLLSSIVGERNQLQSQLAQVTSERDALQKCDACERKAVERACRLHGGRP